MIENLFKQTLAEKGLIKKHDRILLGISGGPDSVCLLHLFAALQAEYKLKLVAVHFNHMLREEAEAEEKFVKNLCKNYAIEFISEQKPVKDFFDGDSLEQTARTLRFDFFLKCSRQTKIKKIALAHHKDDLAETVLMRLIRGAGLKGLRGFLPQTKFKNLIVIRPLINLRKKEILAWLEKKKFSYCLDKSNFEETFLRNKLRLKVIPMLETLNPNIIENFSASAQTIVLDYDFLENFSRQEFERLKRKLHRHSLELDLKGLKNLHEAIFNHVVRIAIEELKGNTRNVESRHLNEIRALVVHRPNGSVVDLPDLIVKKTESRLILEARRALHAY